MYLSAIPGLKRTNINILAFIYFLKRMPKKFYYLVKWEVDLTKKSLDILQIRKPVSNTMRIFHLKKKYYFKSCKYLILLYLQNLIGFRAENTIGSCFKKNTPTF